MPVLQRELEAYQAALDRYRLQVRAHNNQSNQYNNTLLTDANGNVYVRDANGTVYLADAATGQLSAATLPGGKAVADYGNTKLPDSPNYYMLRVNPTQQNYKTVENVTMYTDPDSGAKSYQAADGTYLGPEYKPVASKQVQAGVDPDVGPYYKTIYTMQADDSTYATNPGAFERTFNMKPPSVTAAQLNKMSQPSLATQERTGLISSEIIGGGGGVLSGGVKKVAAPEKPPEVVDPIDPNPPPPYYEPIPG